MQTPHQHGKVDVVLARSGPRNHHNPAKHGFRVWTPENGYPGLSETIETAQMTGPPRSLVWQAGLDELKPPTTLRILSSWRPRLVLV
jgi:hypothetical protein